jgi:hypothetical protein
MRHMPPHARLALIVLLSGAVGCASTAPPVPEIVPEERPLDPYPKAPAPALPEAPREPPAPEPAPMVTTPVTTAVVEPPPFTPASISVPAPRPPSSPSSPFPELPTYNGPDPCRGPAANGDSLVAQACRTGGQPAARARMKEMVRLVRDHGMDFICSDCHPDPTDYAHLTDDAAERFARLAAALPR